MQQGVQDGDGGKSTLATKAEPLVLNIKAPAVTISNIVHTPGFAGLSRFSPFPSQIHLERT